MKKLALITGAFFLTAFSPLFSQNNCFGNCWENFDSISRNVPLSERFAAQYWMLQALEGCPMPAFSVETIDGQEVNSESLKGKVVVMNFWFESCPPCRNELPGLNKLVDYFQGKDVVFIAFGRDSQKSVQDFLTREDFRYLHIADCFNNEILEQFCIMGGFPTNMVFDKNGKLVYLNSGGSVNEAKQMERFEKLKPVIEKCL
jgi:cytochrome c biogenesis protein CcmG, thiol:disulfide interchange protein DsbE